MPSPSAFYLNQKGDTAAAIKVLNSVIAKYPMYADSYLLLGRIYEKQGDKSEAERIYSKALAMEGIPAQYKYRIADQQEASEAFRKQYGKEVNITWERGHPARFSSRSDPPLTLPTEGNTSQSPRKGSEGLRSLHSSLALRGGLNFRRVAKPCVVCISSKRVA